MKRYYIFCKLNLIREAIMWINLELINGFLDFLHIVSSYDHARLILHKNK